MVMSVKILKYKPTTPSFNVPIEQGPIEHGPIKQGLEQDFQNICNLSNLTGHLNLAEKLIELIELTESPFPSYDKVSHQIYKNLA